MCLYPKLIINRKYIPNKKNNYNAPQIKDSRTLYVPIGCGKCMECKKQKGRAWSVRLQEEIKTNRHGEFITLTFSNEQLKYLIEGKDQNGNIIRNKQGKPIKNILQRVEGYPLDNLCAKIAVRRFLERWRKKYKYSLKHWMVTELGHNGTENVHLHGIVFKKEYKHNLEGIKQQYLQEQKQDIEKIWGYGYVYIGDYVNEKTVNYCVKYSTKVDAKNPNYNAIILTSAGIGENYTKEYNARQNQFNEKETNENYITRQGKKMNLPIYWRNKIYTEEQREKLWIKKLDEKVRWVDGTKIDTSKGLEEYYRTLKHAQKKNKRLGYGDDKKDWNKIEYDNQLRQIKIEKRLKNEDLENTIVETTFGIIKYKTRTTQTE